MRLWSFGPEGPSDFHEKPAEASRNKHQVELSMEKNDIRLWHCLRCGRKGRKPQHFCGDTSLNARQDCYCSAVDCLHEATRFELEHGSFGQLNITAQVVRVQDRFDVLQ